MSDASSDKAQSRAPTFTYKCVFCQTKNKTNTPPEDSMLDCRKCGFPTVQTCEGVEARL